MQKLKLIRGFSICHLEDEFVIQQLGEAIKCCSNLSEEGKREARTPPAIESICLGIYRFFNDTTVQRAKNRTFLCKLAKRNWLFLHGKFVESKKAAYKSNGDKAPFLFSLPSPQISKYRNLFEAVQIKSILNDEDCISALFKHKLQQAFVKCQLQQTNTRTWISR